MENYEKEIDSIGIIKLLNQKKIIIIAFTLFVGIVTAGITLQKPNIYSSSTSIILNSPEYAITEQVSFLPIEMLERLSNSIDVKIDLNPSEYSIPKQVSFLTIEMLERLSNSIDVKSDLYEKMQNDGLLKKRTTFEAFQERLRVTVARTLSREKAPLPMIHLSAQAESPQLAADIANKWATIIINRIQALFKSNIGATSSFADKYYKKVSQSLVDIEDEYTSAVLSSNLEINKLSIETKKEAYKNLLDDYLMISDEIQTKKMEIDSLKKRISAREVDGIWFGEKYYAAYKGNYLKDIPITEESRILANVIKSIFEKERSLAEFREKSELDYKESYLENIQLQLSAVHTNLLEARSSLKVAEERYKEFSKNLSDMDEKIILQKAITDDVLWDLHFKGQLPKSSEIPTLKDEIISPVYQDVKNSVIQTASEIKGWEAKIKFFESKKIEIKNKTKELVRDIFLIRSEIEKQETLLNNEKNFLTFLEKEYTDARKSLQTLQPEYAILSAQANVKTNEMDTLSNKIRKLEKTITQKENEINVLRRIMNNFANIETTFAVKRDGMMLLRDLTEKDEGISLHGISVLDVATQNPLKIKPVRSKIVLTSMAVAFIFISMLQIFSWIIKEH